VNAFIHHLYTGLGTASNYSATVNLHNSQITTTHAKPFPAWCVFTSRSLVSASNSGDSFYTDSRTELTRLPRLSSRKLLGSDHVETTHFQQYLYCCASAFCCGNIFTDPLPRNDYMLPYTCIRITDIPVKYDYRIALHYIPEDGTLHSHICEDLKRENDRSFNMFSTGYCRSAYWNPLLLLVRSWAFQLRSISVFMIPRGLHISTSILGETGWFITS
jgi:hypothetical protein